MGVDTDVSQPYRGDMTANNESAAEYGGQQTLAASPETARLADATGAVCKGIVSDLVTQVVSHPGTAAAVSGGLAARAGLRVVNTAITQRGETRREELRQRGETERARIAQQADQDQPPASA
jgi:hypothetical protein